MEPTKPSERIIPKATKREADAGLPAAPGEEAKFTLYAIHDHPPPVVPAALKREWMEQTPERFAYRCLPLNIANGVGWDILCPIGFTASWDGRAGLDAITITPLDGTSALGHLAQSHFGSGVLTFHTGYLIRTSPGLDVLATGSFNYAKHGIAALTGVIETYWLPFGFTMNWRFTAPGTVRFDKGDPFCTVIPFPHTLLDGIQPEIKSLNQNAELKSENERWSNARSEFNKLLHEKDPKTVEQGWQRDYFRGQMPWDSRYSAEGHKVKLRLSDPIDKRDNK